jgi:hypothetical protein
VSAAIAGNAIIVGVPIADGSYEGHKIGEAGIFQRRLGEWNLRGTVRGNYNRDLFGTYVALSASCAIATDRACWTAVVEAPGSQRLYVYTWEDTTTVPVTINSVPSGRSFSVTGCSTGTMQTPATLNVYPGATCGLVFQSVESSAAGTRYAFQTWNDGVTSNSRAITVPAAGGAYVGVYGTQYQLNATSSGGGGSVAGAGWYDAGATATVTASPFPGNLFTGYSGALTGPANPQPLAMNGPKTVTAAFAALQPVTMSALITARSGTAAARSWTVRVSNAGPGTALFAQIHGVSLTQTYGTACAPKRLGPAYPILLGNLAPGGNAAGAIYFDFTGCPATARFTASIVYTANGGDAVGLTNLYNQMQ